MKSVARDCSSLAKGVVCSLFLKRKFLKEEKMSCLFWKYLATFVLLWLRRLTIFFKFFLKIPREDSILVGFIAHLTKGSLSL